MNFTSLHNHSEYSNIKLIDSIIKTTDLIDSAARKSYKGIALTDHEALSGSVRAIRHVQEQKKEGKIPQDFKLILGDEIYLVKEIKPQEEQKFYHFILLAKNRNGFEGLKEISSTAWQQGYMQKGIMRTPITYDQIKSIMTRYKGDIVGSTACLGSVFADLVLKMYSEPEESEQRKRYKDAIHRFIKWCQCTFGKDNFYIELQPSVEMQDQKIYNYYAVQIAREYDVPFIVTTDSHYIDKEDRPIHRNYLQSKQGDREVDEFYSSAYMMNIDEIPPILKQSWLHPDDIEEAIENTMRIYDVAEEYDLEENVSLTEVKPFNFSLKHIFKEYYNELEYIKKYAYSGYEQDQFLLFQIEEAMLEKYGENAASYTIERERINTELEELWKTSENIEIQVSTYYNTAKKIVDLLWNEGDSLVGPGRGSVTGFFICYLLDITQINPIQWNLPHWRHLTAERPELPDIDIDTEETKRYLIEQGIKDFFGEDKVLRIATFGTESTRSAILSSCRGLGISVDTGLYLSSLVPVDRGFNWSIEDCLKGNEEKSRRPIPAFRKEVEKHPQLKETMLKIEGLVNKRSSHAAGIYIYKDHFLNHNAVMLSPKGEPTTQFDMKDSDYMGGVKFDLLTIKALDKIRITLNHLINNGYIEQKPTLIETYKNSIHPDKLDYTTKEMWQMLGSNDVIDLFQFDTEIGSQAAKAVKPQSLEELSAANCLMRLAGEKRDSKTPIEEYVDNKNNIDKWHEEMRQAGISQEEQKILYKHLSKVYGIADTQEIVMQLVLDENIAGFDLVEANKLRKAIGKKDEKTMKEVREKFFEKGIENGTSENLLKYIWNVQIKRQLGYSFSRNHSMPYSLIALQQLNLCYYYPIIYWNTACLTVNSGSSDDEKAQTTDYGKIASSIGFLQGRGVKIGLPDINKAQFSFTPDDKNNKILFGLKAINRIGDDMALTIINNRPYDGLVDFLNKVKTNKTQAIQLIKGGAFDAIENKDRKEILADYIDRICGKKKRITLQNFNMLSKYGLLPEKFADHEEIFYFTRQLRKNKEEDYYILDKKMQDYYETREFEVQLVPKNNKVAIEKTKWEKIYNSYMNEVRKYFKENHDQILESLNNTIFQEEWEKYAQGDVSAWEMEALSFYYHEHELEKVDFEAYDISDFFQLPSKPVVDHVFYKEEKKIEIYKLFRIAGTVLERDKIRHTVTLLTTTGVVYVKFFRDQFAYYDKQVSAPDPDVEGKKKILEKSWFQKGNKIIVTGIRRDDMFYPKVYKNSKDKKPVKLITNFKPNGGLEVVSERVDSEE